MPIKGIFYKTGQPVDVFLLIILYKRVPMALIKPSGVDPSVERGGARCPLVFAAELEGIEQTVANGQTAASRQVRREPRWQSSPSASPFSAALQADRHRHL